MAEHRELVSARAADGEWETKVRCLDPVTNQVWFEDVDDDELKQRSSSDSKQFVPGPSNPANLGRLHLALAGNQEMGRQLLQEAHDGVCNDPMCPLPGIANLRSGGNSDDVVAKVRELAAYVTRYSAKAQELTGPVEPPTDEDMAYLTGLYQRVGAYLRMGKLDQADDALRELDSALLKFLTFPASDAA
jgi:hypothetical protein